ncbi:HEAT repeat domain-containing protein [Deinococcus aquatilis]|uniref:HEAT repeat domain-containing protein n=1 Tax=Deinococcus aquatilis TaxID=519440 RepID=UPI00036ABEDE|nr:HEAT repeat domain-containing protein [Deinococcus aquatilis]
MSALPSELLDVFRTQWARMRAEHPDGLPGDVFDATKAALTVHFAAALQDQPGQVLPALHLAASAGQTEYEVTYEFPMLLMEALTRIDDDGHVLIKLADDQAQPWFLRRAALQALGTRTRPELLPLFRRMLRDNETEGEVRTAALFALVEQDDVQSLNLIRSLSTRGEPWLSAAGPLLEARGRLGDLTATRDLISLAADPWHHRFTAGQRGLVALEERVGGLGPMVQELQAAPRPRSLGGLLGLSRTLRPTPLPLVDRLQALATVDPVGAVRNWATTRLAELEPARAAEVLLQALQDPDWQVLKDASDALSTLSPAPVAELYARMRNPELALDERRWAARTLLLLGEAPDLNIIPDLQVTLPAVVPPAVRSAIIRAYAQQAEAGTDVRWLIEALTLPRWDDAEAQTLQAEHEQVVEALRASGLEVGQPIEAGVWHGQGGGTYVVLPLEGGDLSLSTLGRFAAPHTWGADANHLPAAMDRIRLALTSVGWQWLDDDLLSVKVPGLNVYYFGAREPLRVGELLYYWQD